MYNHEITKLINENLRLDSRAITLILEFYKTQDKELLEQVEQIQKQILHNREKIVTIGGDPLW